MTILNREKILEQARAFIAEGKHDRAIREYEKLLAADPNDLRIKLRMAELYTKRKQIGEAIRIYREVAGAYSAEGFYLKAVTVFKGVLRLNPSLIEINEQLAHLYEMMGLANDAVRQYDILAQAFDAKGQTARAIEMRSKIVALNPADGAQRVKLAEAYQREGRLDEAMDQYEEHARLLEEAGGDKGALADVFEKILAHRPDRREMLKKLIGICEERGDLKRMLKWIESGKDLVEEYPGLLRKAAQAYASQNQNETARTKYMALAELLKRQGDIAGTLEAYCDVLVLYPDEEDRLARPVEEAMPGAMPEIARRARKRREEIEAHEASREAAKAGPHAGGARGEEAVPTSALGEAHQASAGGSEAPDKRAADAAYDLGKAYRQAGLLEEARAEWKKAAEAYRSCLGVEGDSEEVRGRLAQIEAWFNRSKGPKGGRKRKP